MSWMVWWLTTFLACDIHQQPPIRLKDKFEVTDHSSVLSLDDMYMLYEMRFGQEKALKMKEFYTVLKIAFPSTDSGKPTSGPVLEGTSVRGIQIKMSIIDDGKL